MDDVNAMIASEHPGGRRARKASTTPPSPTRPMAHSRVISDRSRNSASVQLLSPLSIPARPRATSTSVVGKHTAAPRRPPFARSVEMHSVRYSARLANGSSNAPNAVEKALGPSAFSSSKVRAVGTPPALNTSDVFYPASPGPHTPTSMFSIYPEYERDMGCKVPFPSDSNAPRTVLHPPENPQMETAIQIDATRVPLGKYDITQDLTFVLRIQNIVTDDVEVVLVKTEESKETVYELKIKKKDPDNMRVRGGIIPYSYVPPFASSASSSSGSSSMCSSPVTTPPLEFPPRHHYGSYFPTAYSNGFLYKTPSRGAMVTKPARNARLSNASSRTPLARSRQSTTTNVTVRDVSGSAPPAIITSNKGQIGLTNAGPPPSPMYGRRVPSAAFNRYESDGDDDEDDNASVLAHYAYRDACPIPAMSPTGSIGRGMKHSENPFFGKSAFTSEDDDYVQEQEGEGIDSSAARPAIKSHWSDTETEQETENEDEGEEAESSSPGCSSLLL